MKLMLLVVALQQQTSAQIFPWSNLKNYFDHKTKNGPGNGGSFQIEHDLAGDLGRSVDRPYRDTGTSLSDPVNHKNEKETQDVSVASVTPRIDLRNTDSEKVNINFESFPVNHKELETVQEKNFKQSLGRGTHKPYPLEQQNYNYMYPPTSTGSQEFESQEPVLITQKPILPQKKNSNQNRISHKTVSILSTNTQQPNIYVTTKPARTRTRDTSTHRPLKPKHKPLQNFALEQPYEQQSEQEYIVENVPAIQANRYNDGLLDYLVPPPLNQQVYGFYNDYQDEKKVLNEMSKLKPPQYTNQYSKKNSGKKHNNNKYGREKNRNFRGENFENERYNDNNEAQSSRNHGRRPVKNQQNIVNKDKSVVNTKRNKYYNHKMIPSSDEYNDYKDTPLPAPSHLNEQVTQESGFLDSTLETGQYNDGQRVEFQMHGQNGPKSYKFGYDTGKGHNRQFRYEERDKHGHVKGHYGYYDKEGKLQVVNYEADPHTGFKAEPVSN